MRKAVAALVAVLLPLPAFAQAAQCTPPEVLPRPKLDKPSKAEPARRIPTASYTLALNWSPQWCRGKAGSREALRCSGRMGRFGFTLHGLWPDGAGTTWPQYCRAAPLLPPAIIRENICATPSADLIQHEWAKHGTCMERDPRAYFGRARALYGAVRAPDMDALSRRQNLTVGQFRDAFLAANPAIPARAVRVRTTREGWLDELWLCLDTRFRYQPCRTTQDGGAALARRLRIWRGGR